MRAAMLTGASAYGPSLVALYVPAYLWWIQTWRPMYLVSSGYFSLSCFSSKGSRATHGQTLRAGWVMWAFDFIFSRRSRVLTCTERFIFYSSHACLYNLGQRALSSSEETTTRKQTTATKQERLVVGRRLR
jgi:hypothetical protein